MNRGNCLCGAQSYEIDGPFATMAHCHCSMCRKHHGTAFATFVAAPASGFRWLHGEDDVRSFASSAHGQRSFCGRCGSVAPFATPDRSQVICPAGNLEDDLGITPQAHWFVGSKAPWYEITDNLPQHREYPPEFGVSGIERPQVATQAGMLQGSCLCGEVAYHAQANVIRMVNCHCSRCRHGRSAAHASNVFVNIPDFAWERGTDHLVDYKVPAARFFAVCFCKTCGSEVPRISIERGIVNIPAGSLDSDPGTRLQAHIFVGSKAPWFEITDRLPQYVEAPPV